MYLVSVPASVGAGVANTPHNLIGSGRGPVTGEEDSSAVCAYCHTPHGESASPPLWQHLEVEEGAGFTTFDSFGRSNLANIEDMGSVSLACVSCHDGVQALNVTLDGPARPPPAGDVMRASSMIAPGSVGPAAQLSVSHPVGIPYGAWRGNTSTVVLGLGAGIRPGATGVRVPSAEDQRVTGFREPLSAIIDGATVWWLETGAEGRQRGDIHLYTRPMGIQQEVPFVECASCHDPHAERANFLRDASGTNLCVSCHAM